MRVIFMGSPDFAVPTLDALVAAGHEVIAAYCQPPRAAGRGKALRVTAVQARAEALGIEVRSPASLRTAEAQAEFAAFGADVAVVAAYGLILPQPILDAPRLGCLNVHGSLLPRWRGAAPVQRAIMAGDELTGVTIMRMEAGLDTGPMLLKREVGIDRKNAGQLTDEIAKIGAEAMVEVLANLDSHPPDPSQTTALPMLPRSARTKRGSTGPGRRARSSGMSRGWRPSPAPGSSSAASGSNCLPPRRSTRPPSPGR